MDKFLLRDWKFVLICLENVGFIDVFILFFFSLVDVIESIIDEYMLMIYIFLLKRKVGFIRFKKRN